MENSAYLGHSLFKSLEKSSTFYLIRVNMEAKYSFANLAFCEKFRHISDNFIGQHFSNSVHPDDVERCNEVTYQCIVTPNKAIKCLVRKPHPNGSYFWTDWEFIGITNEQGEVVEILCVGYDITSLIDKQGQLTRYAQKLKVALDDVKRSNEAILKVNDELDNFVYRVSHDLRAPLTSSLGLIELALLENDVSAIHTFLRLQEKTLQRLDKFINDILDYSRNARKDIFFSDIDIKELVQEAISLSGFDHKDAKFVEHYDIRATLYSDDMRLRVVLNNLISNAFKYRDVKKKDAWVKLSCQVTKKYLKLSVSDNGLGIADEQLNHIFEMFYRGSQVGTGSGLGLYIVQETVSKLQGEIEVKTKLGAGTTFILTVPNSPKTD